MKTHVFSVSTAALLAATLGAAAAPPANDSCLSASAIGPGSGQAFTVAEATVETTSDCLISNADVWFRYTPSIQNGAVTITTAGSAFSGGLSVFTACGGEEITCRSSTNSVGVSFDLTPSTQYTIRAVRRSGTAVDGVLNITETPAPANDNCGGALPIVAGTHTLSFAGTTADGLSTSCTTDPEATFKDLWFEYTANMNGIAAIDGRGIITVYNSCGGPESVCSTSWDGFPITVGQKFKIRFAVNALTTSTVALRIREFAAAANDSCATATNLTVGTHPWNNEGAVDDDLYEGPFMSCPSRYGNTPVVANIWFKFTPPNDGIAVFSTYGYTPDTILEAYTACGGTVLACNDNYSGSGSAGETGSYLAAKATAGQTIYVRMAQVGSGNYEYYRSGSIIVSMADAEPNDECDGALPLTLGQNNYNTRNATDSPQAAPLCAVSQLFLYKVHRDLWYTWTAPQTGTAYIHGCPAISFIANYEPVIAVYDGGCNANEIYTCITPFSDNYFPSRDISACVEENPPIVEFAAIAGRTYTVRVQGWAGSAGAGKLTVGYLPETNDAVDLLSGAQVMSGEGALVTIEGELATGTKANLYKFEICDPEEFSVFISGENFNNLAFYLFDSTGRGITGSDNALLSFPAPLLTSNNIPGPGTYYLAVTWGGYGRLPVSNGLRIWNPFPIVGERTPDGPGAAGSLTGWQGSSWGSNGTYTLNVGGACLLDVCAADFNGDDARDVADLFAYINAWLAKTPNANFNGDGGVDVADLFAYINAWLAGC